MAKQYYKVVQQIGEHTRSAIVGGKSLSRHYTTNAWTRGVNGTPVMAFCNLQSALHFRQSDSSLCVWNVKVKHPRLINMLGDWQLGRPALRFWTAVRGKQWYRLHRTVLTVLGTPPNTVACEAIKLVKKVA
jgi:hypothetical protein